MDEKDITVSRIDMNTSRFSTKNNVANMSKNSGNDLLGNDLKN